MSESKWVSALEAITALGESVAPVEIKASESVMQAEPLLAWLGRGQRSTGGNHCPATDVEIPSEFWWCEGRAGLKQDWHFGDFSTCVDGQIYRAFGVKFCRDGIEKMGGVFLEGGPETRNRGGRRRSDDWQEFIAELCAYIHEVGISPGKGTAGTEKVIEDVTTRLMQRGIDRTVSRSTAQPVINAVLLRLRSEAYNSIPGANRRNPAD